MARKFCALQLSALVPIAMASLVGCGDSGSSASTSAANLSATQLAAAVAAPAKTALPPAMAKWLAERKAECREAGGKFLGGKDYYIAAEFNGDSKPDYVLMAWKLDCQASIPVFSSMGSGGDYNEFLVSTPKGYAYSSGFSADEFDASQIKKRGAVDVVELTGTWHRAGGQVTRVVHGWDGTEMTVLERTNAKGQKVDEEGRPVAAASGQGINGVNLSRWIPMPKGYYATASGKAASCKALNRPDVISRTKAECSKRPHPNAASV